MSKTYWSTTLDHDDMSVAIRNHARALTDDPSIQVSEMLQWIENNRYNKSIDQHTHSVIMQMIEDLAKK